MKSGKSFGNGQHPEWGVALNVQPLVRQNAEHLGARGTEWDRIVRLSRCHARW